MKNVILKSFALIFIFTFSSCSKTIDSVNSTNFYKTYCEKMDYIKSASSLNMITEATYKTSSFSTVGVDNYTNNFMYAKTGDSYEAVSLITSADDSFPVSLNLFFKSNMLYANTSIDSKKLKTYTTYDQFSNAYNDLEFIDAAPENLKSIKISKLENKTLVELVIDGDSQEEYFDKELTNIEFLTKRPRAELSPTFSDIIYNITLNELSDITDLETIYTITALVPVSSIDEILHTNERKLNDTVSREVHLKTTIKDVNNTTIIFPDNLDSYVNQSIKNEP